MNKRYPLAMGVSDALAELSELRQAMDLLRLLLDLSLYCSTAEVIEAAGKRLGRQMTFLEV